MSFELPNPRDRLRRGDILVGMQSFSASPVLVEAMGAGGLDFVTIDMEHCPTGLETVAHVARAAEAARLLPFVRVPELSPTLIGRVLDLGVRGVVIPHASPERCAAALRAARYAPDGDRGACPVVRAAGYLPADWPQYARRANDEVLVIPLIEDVSAVEQADAILGTEGIDVVFLGPFDLAMSYGLSGADCRHPVLAKALADVVEAAQRHGKYVMTTVGATIDHDYAALLVGSGVRLLSFSADVAVFVAACRGISNLRDTVGPGRSAAE